MKRNIFTITLFALLGAAFLVRVYALGSIPVGLTDDELRETYSAAALWQTGRGLVPGNIFPFLFVVNNFSFNPVPVYLSAPFIGLLGVSMFSARLPYALAGFFALVGTYFLIKQLTKNRWIAIATAFCMAFNVWAVTLSRIAYEAVFAQMFYIWGTYLFLRNKFVLSMVLFFLAFNSYDATKFLYVPLLATLIIYEWKKVRKYAWIIAGSAVLTFSLFAYLYVFQYPGARGGQFTIFRNIVAARESVEFARRASAAPEFLKILYHNKVTYFFDVFMRHFLYTFSWDYLFFSQEASGIFSLWLRGNFYLLEIPFLFLGALYLFVKKRAVFVLSLVAMLIGALPAGIGPEPFTYATRASFALPWLAFWIGAGIVYAIESVRKKWIMAAVIAGLYVYFIGGYLQQYYFEWARSNAVYFSRGIEDLIRYLSPYASRYTIEVANVNDTFFLHWKFVTKTDPATVKLLSSCKTTLDDLDTKTIYAASTGCHKEPPDHLIVLPDGTPQWAIYMPRM